jgi:hypothetical protein
MLRTLTALLLLLMFAQGALASLETHYEPDSRVTAKLPPRADATAVEVRDGPPQRSSVILGRWSARGTTATTREEFLAAARLKAAELGADFVAVANVVDNTRRVPGPRGSGSPRSGGNVSDARVLHAVFGVYAKGALGIEFADAGPAWGRRIVKAFRQDSKAPAAGMEVGDEILEVDGIPMSDGRYPDWVIANQPGQVARVRIRRGDATLEVGVPLVPNN